MAQLFETVCMSLVFNKSHSLAMHYCRLVWDVRSLSKYVYRGKEYARRAADPASGSAAGGGRFRVLVGCVVPAESADDGADDAVDAGGACG